LGEREELVGGMGKDVTRRGEENSTPDGSVSGDSSESETGARIEGEEVEVRGNRGEKLADARHKQKPLKNRIEGALSRCWVHEIISSFQDSPRDFSPGGKDPPMPGPGVAVQQEKSDYGKVKEVTGKIKIPK